MIKNRITQFSRWLVTAYLIASILPFSLQGASAERLNVPASTQLVVDTFTDYNDNAHQACTDAPGNCSLRGAILKANGDPSRTYEIILPAGMYKLSSMDWFSAGGDLDVNGSIILFGAGATSTTIDAQGIDRVFRVYLEASVTIQGITVMGGKTGDGQDDTPGFGSAGGGGIENKGSLVLKDSVVRENTTGDGGNGFICEKCPPGGDDTGGESGSGGGVYNSGWLRVENTMITDNHTGTGGTGGTGFSCHIGNGGKSGDGGGIYNTGTMLLIDSQVMDNSISPGGRGVCGLGGDGGSGGGVHNAGIMQVNGTTFSSNTAGAGGERGGAGYGGGAGGSGGGIYNSSNLSLVYSPVMSNTAGSGGEGYGGGAGGSGGGIYNSSNLSLVYSPVMSNAAGSGSNASIGYGGAGGSGGGIFNSSSLSLVYSPVMSNMAGSGGVTYSQYYYGGVGGSGGGIYNLSNLSLAYSSIMSNTSGRGEPGGSGGGISNTGWIDLLGGVVNGNKSGLGGNPDSRGGNGGGIDSGQGNLQLTNAIVTENCVEPGGMGSGLYVGSTAMLVHTTLARNTGGDGSGIYLMGSILTLTNTILVSHTLGITASLGSSVLLDSTLWGSGAWANISDWGGSGTFTSTHDYYGDPGFVDPENGDYHILPTSPAIDLGVPTSTTVDIDNQPRPNPSTGTSPGIPDLGADEYWLFTPIFEVLITGPSLIFTSLEATYTATISPTVATPNITYYWFPEPKIGQGTDTVNYNNLIPGTYTITVTAFNAGSSVTASQQVIVVFGPHPIFLPLVAWKGLLSP